MSTRTLHTAEILLPISRPPLRGGGVVVDESGIVLEVGQIGSLTGSFDERHQHQIVMPGVLNCHTHLTDAQIEEPVPGGEGLTAWVLRLLALRYDNGSTSRVAESSALQGAVENVLDEMQEGGTVAVGEVSNNLRTLTPISRANMQCRFVQELIGFNKDRASQVNELAEEEPDSIRSSDHIHFSLGAHAPYSVSPQLMQNIVRCNRQFGRFTYQHLAEDPAERELYECASGSWREYLEEIGAWEPSWRAQGMSPIEYYDHQDFLDEHFVAVHLADATENELGLLAKRRVMAILSPTSNVHINRRLPPFDKIVRSGIAFALGTDGRGSNPSVDVFDEAALLLEHWPDIAPGVLLRALTSSGAAILQLADLGTIEVGKKPGLIAVESASASDDLGHLERQILLEAQSRRRIA